jgi:hypothetical protein
MDGKRVAVHGRLVEACRRISSAATGTAEGVLSALCDEIGATGRLAVVAAYRFRNDGSSDPVHPAGPKPDDGGRLVRSRAGAAGSLQGGTETWARTYPLESGGREWGCVVVTAPTSPDLVEETSVAVLVVQAGMALALVVAREDEQARAEELAAVTAQREGRALLDDLLDGEKDGVSVQDMSARAHALGHTSSSRTGCWRCSGAGGLSTTIWSGRSGAPRRPWR